MEQHADPFAGCMTTLLFVTIGIILLPVLLILMLVSALAGQPVRYDKIIRDRFRRRHTPQNEPQEAESYRNESDDGVIDVEAIPVDRKDGTDGTSRHS